MAEEKERAHISEIREWDPYLDELIYERIPVDPDRPKIVLFSTAVGRNIFMEKFLQSKPRTW